jgi:hypothetical protein
MSETDLVKELLIRGLDDWLYFAEVDAIATKYLSELPNDAVKAATLRLIEGLSRDGLVEIGNVLKDRGFVPWHLSSEDSIALIRTKWLSLEHPLWPGDVCWLSLTEKGKQEAKRIIENGEAPPGVLTEN